MDDGCETPWFTMRISGYIMSIGLARDFIFLSNLGLLQATYNPLQCSSLFMIFVKQYQERGGLEREGSDGNEVPPGHVCWAHTSSSPCCTAFCLSLVERPAVPRGSG